MLSMLGCVLQCFSKEIFSFCCCLRLHQIYGNCCMWEFTLDQSSTKGWERKVATKHNRTERCLKSETLERHDFERAWVTSVVCTALQFTLSFLVAFLSVDPSMVCEKLTWRCQYNKSWIFLPVGVAVATGCEGQSRLVDTLRQIPASPERSTDVPNIISTCPCNRFFQKIHTAFGDSGAYGLKLTIVFQSPTDFLLHHYRRLSATTSRLFIKCF